MLRLSIISAITLSIITSLNTYLVSSVTIYAHELKQAKFELAQWQGTYSFTEATNSDSVTMVMVYEINIYPSANNYLAKLSVNGQTTSIQVNCNVKKTGKNKIGLYFKSYRDGNLFEFYKPDELLLQLEQLSANRIRVIWGSLTPMLTQNSGSFVPEDLIITQ